MRKYDGFGDGHSKHFAEGDCEELMDAAKSMFESRRVIKFTCVSIAVRALKAVASCLELSHVTWRLQNSYVREFLLEKAIFLLEDEHGPDSEIVVSKNADLLLFKQWQEPYINAIDKLSEMIERPDAVRLLKPVRFVSFPPSLPSSRPPSRNADRTSRACCMCPWSLPLLSPPPLSSS